MVHRELARKFLQPAAAVSACMGLARVHGLIVDKHEKVSKSSVQEFSDAELERLLAERLRITNWLHTILWRQTQGRVG